MPNKKLSPKSKLNLSERVLISLTLDERTKLEAKAAEMTSQLGVPVSLSAAGRALVMDGLRKRAS